MRAVGLLGFYRTGSESYLALNMYYLQGKNNPEGYLEIIKVASLVSKDGRHPAFNTLDGFCTKP